MPLMGIIAAARAGPGCFLGLLGDFCWGLFQRYQQGKIEIQAYRYCYCYFQWSLCYGRRHKDRSDRRTSFGFGLSCSNNPDHLDYHREKNHPQGGLPIAPLNNLLSYIPLAQAGFPWILPAVIGGMIGGVVKGLDKGS